MAVSKVVYGNTPLIDLTADTVTAEDLAFGVTAHGADGNLIVGTNDYDSNTSDATATAAEILSGKTAYVNTNKLAGTMPNRGAVNGAISGEDAMLDSIISASTLVAAGIFLIFHVSLEAWLGAIISLVIIKSGVEILGVEGTYAGEAVSAQSKSATPYTTAQVILPDDGYDYLSQVSIEAIPYVETQNAAGGLTVTIGAVKAE